MKLLAASLNNSLLLSSVGLDVRWDLGRFCGCAVPFPFSVDDQSSFGCSITWDYVYNLSLLEMNTAARHCTPVTPSISIGLSIFTTLISSKPLLCWSVMFFQPPQLLLSTVAVNRGIVVRRGVRASGFYLIKSLSQLIRFRAVVDSPSSWCSVEVWPTAHAIQSDAGKVLRLHGLKANNWDDSLAGHCAAKWFRSSVEAPVVGWL